MPSPPMPESPQSPPAARGRVTAAMVAARAGVSTATVSLVNSGKTAGRVSPEITARVQAAVAELGYVVNVLGSSLAKGRSNMVILVAPDVSNPFYAKVIAGVREGIGPDFHLLLSVTEAGETPQAADVQRLLGLRPAGLLIDAPSASFLAALEGPDPVVLLDAAGIASNAPSVNFDVAGGARALATHLAGLGHKVIAYLDSTTGTETFRVRRDAFRDQARRLGMVVAGEAAATIDVGMAARAFTRAWDQWGRQGVSAVVCATDTHAYGVLQEARVAGLAVPQDLAVTGFDDLPYSQTSNPGLTTVQLPASEMGKIAGQELRRLMEGQAPAAKELSLDAVLVVRGSTVARR